MSSQMSSTADLVYDTVKIDLPVGDSVTVLRPDGGARGRRTGTLNLEIEDTHSPARLRDKESCQPLLPSTTYSLFPPSCTRYDLHCLRMARGREDTPDEQTALLSGGKRAPKAAPPPITPLPRLQIGILLLLQLAEPITSQCIYPFINQVSCVLPLVSTMTLSRLAACPRARHHRWRREEGRVLCGVDCTCLTMFACDTSTYVRTSGIRVFLDRGHVRSPMVSCIGLHWSEASPSNWYGGPLCLHGSVRSLEDVLAACCKVYYIVTLPHTL